MAQKKKSAKRDYRLPGDGDLIFRSVFKTSKGKVLHASDYGIRAWPVIIGTKKTPPIKSVAGFDPIDIQSLVILERMLVANIQLEDWKSVSTILLYVRQVVAAMKGSQLLKERLLNHFDYMVAQSNSDSIEKIVEYFDKTRKPKPDTTPTPKPAAKPSPKKAEK